MAIVRSLFVNIVQSLLDVRLQVHEPVCNSLRDAAVSVKSARVISSVPELAPDIDHDLRGDRRHARHVFVRFAAFLPVAHENHGRAEVTGVAHEAA